MVVPTDAPTTAPPPHPNSTTALEEDAPFVIDFSLFSAIVWSPVVITSIQAFAVIADSPCASAAMRTAAKDTSWTVSPLQAIFGDFPGLAGNTPASIVIWNALLLIAFTVLHATVTFILKYFVMTRDKDAAEAVYFPTVSLFFGSLLKQGTTHAIGKHVTTPNNPIGWSIVVSVLGIAHFAVLLGTWHVVRRRLTLPDAYREWPEVKVAGTWQYWVLPRGAWFPLDFSKKYGEVYADSQPECVWYQYPLLVFQSTLLGFLTGVSAGSTTGCDAIVWLLLISTVIVAGVFAFRLPLRSRMLSIARAVALLGLAGVFVDPGLVPVYLATVQGEMILSCCVGIWEYRNIIDLQTAKDKDGGAKNTVRMRVKGSYVLALVIFTVVGRIVDMLRPPAESQKEKRDSSHGGHTKKKKGDNKSGNSVMVEHEEEMLGDTPKDHRLDLL